MTQIPFFIRTDAIDKRREASMRRAISRLIAGLALGLVLGALVWQGPAVRAANSGGSPPGGTPVSIPPAWTDCSAGNKLADTNPSAVHGLFVADTNNFDAGIEAAMTTHLLSDPTICGFTVIIPWSAIDNGPCPTIGGLPLPLCTSYQQYDFTYLDTEVKQWTTNTDGTSNGKIVNLSVWGADEHSTAAGVAQTGKPATPAWLLNSLSSSEIVSSSSCSESETPGTPVYWKPSYSEPWQAFQQALVNYVNSAPYTAQIGYIRFGLGAGDEDFPVDGSFSDPSCWSAWTANGLTATQWQSWSIGQVDFEAKLGSTHPIGVSINGFAGAPDLPGQVAAEAAKNGMVIGMEGMTEFLAQYAPSSAQCDKDWCAPFATWEGKVPLLVQGYTQSCPSGGGPTGALPPLLSNAVGLDHAQVIELYPQEWLVADDLSWVVKALSSAKPPCSKSTYADYGAAYAQALDQAACAVGGQSGALNLCFLTSIAPPPPGGFPLP